MKYESLSCFFRLKRLELTIFVPGNQILNIFGHTYESLTPGSFPNALLKSSPEQSVFFCCLIKRR